MTDYVQTRVANRTGIITLDRPKALNSLSLDMVRELTATLLAWRDDAGVDAVFIGSTSAKALCAGGDIRFFHQAGSATPQTGSPLLDDFFTEEYALNHLIHFYPKPYIALMDGVVMGGGMGIAQGGPGCGLRIVTERSRIAMPEVNIGLFPDVGGSHFLSHAPGRLGHYLGVTGATIGAADAIYVGLLSAQAENGRSLLIVFTDGRDTASWLTDDEILDAAKRANAVIYVLAAEHARGWTILRDLAEATGGHGVDLTAGSDLSDEFQKILEDFRSRYILTFVPAGVAQAGFHRLDVTVRRGGLVVKARPGYIGKDLHE